jgi:hypothetical protein
LRIPSVIDYKHLESNRALPHPLKLNTCSEVQQNYKVPLGNEEEYARQKKEKLDDRNTRIQVNKSTHYVAGYDPPVSKTEHVSTAIKDALKRDRPLNKGQVQPPNKARSHCVLH